MERVPRAAQLASDQFVLSVLREPLIERAVLLDAVQRSIEIRHVRQLQTLP